MMVAPRVHWLVQHWGDVPRHNGWLSPGELEVLRSKRVVKRRADWRLGRWTAKRALLSHRSPQSPAADYNDIEIRAAADGAPEVFANDRRMPVALSLSHSHGTALCAVADVDTAIGCDAELIEGRSDAFVSDYFARSERAAMKRTRRDGQALMATLIWSAKESVLKAMREGLRHDPRDVVVDLPLDTPRREWSPYCARCRATGLAFDGWWQMCGGHVFTVARRTGPLGHAVAERSTVWSPF